MHPFVCLLNREPWHYLPKGLIQMETTAAAAAAQRQGMTQEHLGLMLVQPMPILIATCSAAGFTNIAQPDVAEVRHAGDSLKEPGIRVSQSVACVSDTSGMSPTSDSRQLPNPHPAPLPSLA